MAKTIRVLTSDFDEMECVPMNEDKRTLIWLTRQRNGDFMLTALKPTIDQIAKTLECDVYIRPGEPFGLRHLCVDGVAVIWGEWTREMVPLASQRVWVIAGQCEQT